MDYKKSNRNPLILELCKKDIEIARYIMKVASLELEKSILERKCKEIKSILPSLSKVVDYLWEDEQRHLDESDIDNLPWNTLVEEHIFLELNKIKDFLNRRKND